MFRDLLGHFVDIIGELFKQEEIWILLFFVVVGGAVVVALPGVNIIRIFVLVLPFLLFLALFPAFMSLWFFWRNEVFKKSIKFILLELRIPREIKKSSQAMEQVVASLHSLRNSAGNIREKYWDGEITRWFSLEMVSFSGEVHFYVRVYRKHRNLVEAAFFSYYPDIEIVEVEDYVDSFPDSVSELYGKDMDMWSTEMLLRKDDAYPIRTYPYFERQEKEEERLLDPISAFLEVLSKLKEGETVGIQILIAPKSPDWSNKWDSLVEKLQEPAIKTIRTPAYSEAEGGGSRQIPIARTPGQVEILEAVENNLSKSAFDTLIRFVYLSPKSIFYDSFARRGLTGAFDQYSALNLNSFGQNYAMSTRTMVWYWPHLFPKWRNEYRKQRLLRSYRLRDMPPETFMGRLITSYLLSWNFHSHRFILNTESIATVFHPPTSITLTEPHLKHLESRRKGPPAGLAIFGEEEEIEKYK